MNAENQIIEVVVSFNDGRGNTKSVEVVNVKALREHLGVTQKTMSEAFSTSTGTIKAWEQKRREPSNLAHKALLVVAYNPHLFELFLNPTDLKKDA